MARAKMKTRGVNVPTPQTRDEAAAMLRAIGDNARAIARIEADMNDRLAKIKEDAERDAGPFRSLADQMMEGLKTWCEANREALTDGYKRQTADLGTGLVSWRRRPARVTIKKVEDVIAAIKTLGLLTFLRTTEEVDKEAMLKEPEKARLLAGVTIGSEGETFAVEPFEAQIHGAAA